MGCAVDEVCVGDEGGGQADHGAVEAYDEDFGVGVEGLGYVEVEGYAILGRRSDRGDGVSCFLVLLLPFLIMSLK